MKKLGPLLLIILFAAIGVLSVMLYLSSNTADKYASLAEQRDIENYSLKSRFQTEERLKLEETIKEVLVLERRAKNHRISIDHLREKIKIKEDWMYNPQKYWYVGDDGEVINREVDTGSVLSQDI